MWSNSACIYQDNETNKTVKNNKVAYSLLMHKQILHL